MLAATWRLISALSLARSVAGSSAQYAGWAHTSSGQLVYPPRPDAAPKAFGPVQGGCVGNQCSASASVQLPGFARTFNPPAAFKPPDCDGTAAAGCARLPRAATLPYAMQGEAPSFTSGAGGVAGGTSSPFASASGDVDGDGNVDLFVGNAGGEANELWISDGLGGFTAAAALASNLLLSNELVAHVTAAAFADVDGDGVGAPPGLNASLFLY